MVGILRRFQHYVDIWKFEMMVAKNTFVNTSRLRANQPKNRTKDRTHLNSF